MTKRLMTTALALLAVGAGGCGGSSSSSSSSSSGGGSAATGAATTTGATSGGTSTAATGGVGASGGASTASFKAAFKAYETSSASLGPDFGRALTTASKKTNGQIATEFGSLAKRVAATGGVVRKLQPPAQYQGQVSTLARDFDAVAADLQTISHDATVGDANGAEKTTVKVIRDVAALRAVDARLRRELGLPPG